MQNLSPDEQQRLHNELGSGESLVWAGKPNPSVIFHPSDWYMIPGSLMWGGFAIFWEAGVGGDHAPLFFMLWGVPFVLIGQYMIWGRFLYAAWKKRRILYAITTRRILVMALPPRSKIISTFLESIPVIDRNMQADGIGTIRFGQIAPPWVGGGNNNASMDGLYLTSGVPVFVDIDDAASVYSIVADLRTRATKTQER